MKVVSINDHSESKRKDDLLEILDELRERIQTGEIEEFVAASCDRDGKVQIHVCTKDIVGSVGMFEIGKQILIQTQS